MPNTQRGRELLFPYDQKLERTQRNLNRIFGINDDDPNHNIQALPDLHGQLLLDDSCKINKGEKIPLHILKNTKEVMIILQTLMVNFSCPHFHKDTPLW